MLPSDFNLIEFRAGLRAELQKQATLASGIGNVMESIFPETTKNILRPAWHGIKQSPSWSLDALMNSAAKGIKGHEVANIENHNNLGLRFNKDNFGNIIPDNPINLSETLGNLGNKAYTWIKDNPLQSIGGAGLALGGGMLLSSLFKQRPKEVVPTRNYNPREIVYPSYYNYEEAYSPVTALSKYKFGEYNLGNYLQLSNAVPLSYRLATKLPQVWSRPATDPVASTIENQAHDITVSTEDKKLRKLLAKPEMQNYILNLIKSNHY